MPDPVPMTVTGGEERLTRRAQIEQVLARAQARAEPIRIRLPLTIYDYADNRSYAFLRDAAWNLQLPLDQVTPDTIEGLIRTIGACIVAIATHGSAAVEVALDGIGRAGEEEGLR